MGQGKQLASLAVVDERWCGVMEPQVLESPEFVMFAFGRIGRGALENLVSCVTGHPKSIIMARLRLNHTAIIFLYYPPHFDDDGVISPRHSASEPHAPISGLTTLQDQYLALAEQCDDDHSHGKGFWKTIQPQSSFQGPLGRFQSRACSLSLSKLLPFIRSVLLLLELPETSLPDIIPVLLTSGFPVVWTTMSNQSTEWLAPHHFEPEHSSRLQKRKQTHDDLNLTVSLTDSYDDCDRPIASRQVRRKSSPFGTLAKFKFPSFKAPRNEGYEMPNNEGSNQQGMCEKPSLDGDGAKKRIDSSNTSGPGSQEKSHERELKRRSSTFGSIVSGVKKSFFTVTRRRKGSTMWDTSAPTSPNEFPSSSNPFQPLASLHNDPHWYGERLHLSASIEPLAELGTLRFINRSVDELESFDGPSTYWRSENYHNRSCVFESKHSSRLATPRGRSPGPSTHVQTETNTPTPWTNAESGTEPHRWRKLRDWSPSPAVGQRSRPQSSHGPSLPTFLSSPFRSLNRACGKGKKPCQFPRHHRRTSRAPSPRTLVSPPPAFQVPTNGRRRPSITSSTVSISNPDLFGPAPNLSFSPSFNNLGVLPDSDQRSDSLSLQNIPHATFSPSPNSSMIPLHIPPTDDDNGPGASPLDEQSRSPSLLALQPAPLYPLSPPLDTELAPLLCDSSTASLSLPSPTTSPVSLTPSYSNTALLDPGYPLCSHHINAHSTTHSSIHLPIPLRFGGSGRVGPSAGNRSPALSSKAQITAKDNASQNDGLGFKKIEVGGEKHELEQRQAKFSWEVEAVRGGFGGCDAGRDSIGKPRKSKEGAAWNICVPSPIRRYDGPAFIPILSINHVKAQGRPRPYPFHLCYKGK
ncbi:uncharacterized protein BDR25DRAFT_394887 [Lindgomyces ingoldianus]|uniref:Uncharacterized protein n=1 Tax=Lindgomyces ingoldianus TaxID=673940 RepID=A0ACB6QMG2_9PLEO|nr:uncharacterized protein BDR25DRAFT_394887 [Lindgomyces ingoldianus]KAF2468086.1 hypothetical protein BDR25DRAFT_394887 [Lindgomyces ingoldianus]